jgi:hypothetical protein
MTSDPVIRSRNLSTPVVIRLRAKSESGLPRFLTENKLQFKIAPFPTRINLIKGAPGPTRKNEIFSRYGKFIRGRKICCRSEPLI